MAVFEIADAITGGHEGGYANNGADKGGETYKGIARKFHRHLSLWKYVDMAKNEMGVSPADRELRKQWTKHLNARLEDIPALQKAITEFYRMEFWDSQHLSLITSQQVANWIYDHHVNAGARGIKWAQEAAGVASDGQISSLSVAAINAMEPNEFLKSAREIAGAYRLKKIQEDPTQRQFVHSWLSRDGYSEDEINEMLA